jgi:glyoxylase-like metal-dependent hydrolase (beta-lactamase superfamily II)
MRVHHLNCGTMCPLGGRLMDARTRGIGPARLVCHCLAIETERGLVLVDTGFGERDVAAPYPRLSRVMVDILRAQLRPEETARRQLERLGFQAADVRHIVLTHLDYDHAGGLQDFPQAQVHVMRAEAHAVHRRYRPVERGRYRPLQWTPMTHWALYDAADGDGWFGFRAVRALEGLPPEILMIPLVGHTVGHAGVAISTGDGWLLHAGDAYFFEGEIDPEHPRSTPGLRAYQRLMEVDRRSRLWNQQRLRELVRLHGREVRVFSAHDAAEYDRLAPAPAPGTAARPAAEAAAPAP